MEEEKKEQVMKKEYFYRGKSIDYLKGLDVRESAKYLTSRARRTIMRNFDVIEKFLVRCEKKTLKNKKIRTHLREIVIVPKMVGMVIEVYNGKSFEEVHLIPEMIGHRLGDFSITTVIVKHGGAGIGSTKGSRAMKK